MYKFKNRTLIVELDDYPLRAKEAIEYLDALKSAYPDFKVTIFAIPNLMTPDLWKPLIERKDWIRVCPHGFTHDKGECRRKRIGVKEYCHRLENVLKTSTMWSKMVKPPWYGYCHDFALAAFQLGLTLNARTRDQLYGKLSKNDPIYELSEAMCFFKNEEESNKVIIFGHSDTKQSIERKSVRRYWKNEMKQGGTFVFTEDVTEPLFYKVNLGCGEQVIDGWENLDPRVQLNPKIRQWEWGQPLPFPDNSCSIILIQHVLMYCDKEQYVPNLMEIKRVLSPLGKLIIKEDNNEKWIWRKEGTRHRTGTIRSNTNKAEMEHILNQCGFTVREKNHGDIIRRYGDIINRQRKLDRDICFVFECEKA